MDRLVRSALVAHRASRVWWARPVPRVPKDRRAFKGSRAEQVHKAPRERLGRAVHQVRRALKASRVFKAILGSPVRRVRVVPVGRSVLRGLLVRVGRVARWVRLARQARPVLRAQAARRDPVGPRGRPRCRRSWPSRTAAFRVHSPWAEPSPSRRPVRAGGSSSAVGSTTPAGRLGPSWTRRTRPLPGSMGRGRAGAGLRLPAPSVSPSGLSAFDRMVEQPDERLVVKDRLDTRDDLAPELADVPVQPSTARIAAPSDEMRNGAARESALDRLAAMGAERRPSSHGTANPVPWLLGAVTAFNLWYLRGHVRAVHDLNDGSFHAAYVRWAADRIAAGRSPFDGLFTPLGLGFPIFHHYQVLPHVLAGAAGSITDPGLVYRWTLFLLIALWPLGLYGAARLLGLARGAAAGAASSPPSSSRCPATGTSWAATRGRATACGRSCGACGSSRSVWRWHGGPSTAGDRWRSPPWLQRQRSPVTR